MHVQADRRRLTQPALGPVAGSRVRVCEARLLQGVREQMLLLLMMLILMLLLLLGARGRPAEGECRH